MNKVTTLKTLAIIAGLAAVSCTSLHPPGLISPAGAEGLLTTTPEFTWHPAGNARSYLVEISTDRDFTETIDTMIFADTSFVLADTLVPGQDYYWRISSRTAQGAESDASDEETFYVKDGVKLLTPEASDSAAWPEFSWESYPGAVTYRFLISRYADFMEVLLDTTIDSTSLAWPDSLAPATYFWYVQAFDGNQHVSAPSVVRRLVTYRMADTYFPLYVGRRQTFNRIMGSGTYNISTNEIDTTDWEVSTWEIEVNSTFTYAERLYWSLSDTFWDVGSVFSLHHDSIFSPVFFAAELYPDDSGDFRTWSDTMFSTAWLAETLNVYFSLGDSGLSYFKHIRTKRLPGQGTVEQYYRLENIIDSVTHSWFVDHMHISP